MFQEHLGLTLLADIHRYDIDTSGYYKHDLEKDPPSLEITNLILNI